MKKIRALVIVAGLAISACGSDGGGGGGGGGDQARLADLMIQDDEFGFVDADCIRDKTKDLSDDDAKILADNINADSVEGLGLSSEGELWVVTLIDCISDIPENEISGD